MATCAVYMCDTLLHSSFLSSLLIVPNFRGGFVMWGGRTTRPSDHTEVALHLGPGLHGHPSAGWMLRPFFGLFIFPFRLELGFILFG